MKEYDKKLNFAMDLIKEGFNYRQIQEKLHEKFGSSVSNSTIKRLHRKVEEDYSKDAEIARLRKELEIFRTLYFELVEKIKTDKKKASNPQMNN